MIEPVQECQLCGRVEIVKPDGRGFPPRIAEKLLRLKCNDAGCVCAPQYRAGISPELQRFMERDKS